MNRREIVDAIATKSGLDHATADAVLSATTAVISEALATGEKVMIPGFGSFEARSRAARTGRNPQTGEPMEIAASTTPAFKPATAFKQAVSGS